MKEGLRNRIQTETTQIKKEVRERTLGYLLAGFGVVAGIAWNNAVTSLINSIFPTTQNTIIAKFVYAIVMTLVLVLVSVYLTRIFRRGEEPQKQ